MQTLSLNRKISIIHNKIKWLNDILSEKLFLSSERVRGLIDFLVDNKLIEKKVESKGYSYIIQENNSWHNKKKLVEYNH